MKTFIKNLFLLPALIVGLGLIPAGRVTAQAFTILNSFIQSSDGSTPEGGLILSGNTLYGTAYSGGSSYNGTVFAVNIDGTSFTNLHSFTYGSDGGTPWAGLLLSGNTLYGTAASGGSSGHGTVFKVNTDGTGFTILHNFTVGSVQEWAGGEPHGGLILSGNTLYGTAVNGGTSSYGTVFKVNTDGTGFMILHSCTFAEANPYGGLILSGNTLYGTARGGSGPGYGGSSYGTVFAVNTDGTGFTTLHSFTESTSPDFQTGTNSDGFYPFAGLILSGNTLYGVALAGGTSAHGTVFAVNTDGTGFTTLHSFTAFPPSYGTNSDGANPEGQLILSGNTLYGTAFNGGSAGAGTVFAVNTDGTGFTNLHSFDWFTEGGQPRAGLILSGDTLYGTATGGGSSSYGTVFSLSLGSVSAPQLLIIRAGANIVLTWPTDAAGSTLQSATNLVSPAVWGNATGTFQTNGGSISFVLPLTYAEKFYRLVKP